MKALIGIMALVLAVAPCAAAAPGAQAAYVERRGLLEADARCQLLDAEVRMALDAGARQASGTLLRSGWTRARLARLEAATVEAAGARACDDPRTRAAAEQARASFAAWARLAEMTFAGGARDWRARRGADAEGWRLRQDIDAGASFGVREIGGAERLCLIVSHGGAAPASAQLAMRDPARADASFIELPGRAASGVAAGAPPPRATQVFWARERRLETGADGVRRAVYVFPDAAFGAMLALDPREALEARLGTDTNAQRLLIEVGDVAAARAFLALSQR